MQEFWRNVFRYFLYFFSILLGVFLSLARPLLPLLQRPTTAIALMGILVSGLAFLAFTLRAMLGLA